MFSIGGLIGIAVVLFAAWRLWGAFKDWQQYRASADWQPIPAQILESRIEESASGIKDEKDETYSYTPIITYSYQVMGQSYQGNLISFGSGNVSYTYDTKPKKIIGRHPVGSPATVYYNPADPSQSVLERNFNWSNMALWGAAGLAGVFTIFYWAGQ